MQPTEFNDYYRKKYLQFCKVYKFVVPSGELPYQDSQEIVKKLPPPENDHVLYRFDTEKGKIISEPWKTYLTAKRFPFLDR